jgi:cytochrome c-type biogenesis protein
MVLALGPVLAAGAALLAEAAQQAQAPPAAAQDRGSAAPAAGGTTSGQAPAPGSPAPKAAPGFSLPALDGRTVRLSDFAGKSVLVNFWASWCIPCRGEIPEFIKLRNELAPRGFEIVGVAMWDDPDIVRRFVDGAKIPYPVVLGTDETAADYGNVSGLPTSFLIDRQGRIVKRYFAVKDETLRQLEADVRGLVEGGGVAAPASASRISLLTAFLAGLFSFLSPCVLPLVPSYVSFITGISFEEITSETRDDSRVRRMAAIHSALFIVGFSLIFILMGASATYLGGFFFQHRTILERVVGALIIVFGIHITGLINIRFLLSEKRFHLQDKPLGYFGSVLVGFSFGVGWTPCIGPILGSILGYAATIGNLSSGILLLAFYSLGLAIPFFVSSLAINSFLYYFKRIRRFIPAINTASGIFLIAVGILIFSGQFTRLASVAQEWMSRLIPGFKELG